MNNYILSVIEKLLSLFRIVEYGSNKIASFELWIHNDNNITIDLVKFELQEAIGNVDFNWVDLALKTKFVYNANDLDAKNLDVDDLLIFTDSFRWKDVVSSDAILSLDQREEIKEEIRGIGVQNFGNIEKLIEHSEFDWLPFEVKHAYKSSFGLRSYVNQDIIFYLKKILWEYLYPNALDSGRLKSIKEECLPLFTSQQINQGWVEMSLILESIQECFPGIDLYEMSRVDWGKDIQHKIHYRNPFTLGFKRIAR